MFSLKWILVFLATQRTSLRCNELNKPLRKTLRMLKRVLFKEREREFLVCSQCLSSSSAAYWITQQLSGLLFGLLLRMAFTLWTSLPVPTNAVCWMCVSMCAIADSFLQSIYRSLCGSSFDRSLPKLSWPSRTSVHICTQWAITVGWLETICIIKIAFICF